MPFFDEKLEKDGDDDEREEKEKEPTLKGADVAIFAHQNTEPKEKSMEQSLQEFSKAVIGTVGSGGSVVIPCTPWGIMIDAIEQLWTQQLIISGGSGMRKIPIFIVSEAAHDIMEFTTVCGEWVEKTRAEKVFSLMEAFAHTTMIKSGILKVFSSACGNITGSSSFGSIFKEPCIVFASHSNCQSGDVVHFIELFGSNSKNLIILIGLLQKKIFFFSHNSQSTFFSLFRATIHKTRHFKTIWNNSMQS